MALQQSHMMCPACGREWMEGFRPDELDEMQSRKRQGTVKHLLICDDCLKARAGSTTWARYNETQRRLMGKQIDET